MLLFMVLHFFPSSGNQHKVTSAYHPQTNGLDERLNQTLQRTLSKLVDEQHEWDCYLPSVVFAYNTSRQSSTGYTPFELMYGRKAVLPLEIQYTDEDEAELGKK